MIGALRVLFNSIHFLYFLPIVVLVYFLSPHRFRWVWLLAASYYFYMCWEVKYALLIFASTVVDYFAGLRMERCGEKGQRRKYLVLSLVANLGLLFFFKYFNFFNGEVRQFLNHYNVFYGFEGFEKILLPVGISFYTFQTLSYTIDVYRGERKAERHFGIFALYVSFFPQLVAGPIERSTRLMPQFFEQHDFDYDRVKSGVKLMLWGFFKKLVIADRLAAYVDAVYNNPTAYEGIPLIVATYFFAFQIYCDFSGYSDIAIGAARVMGFRLMDNFNRPYFAESISDFWKRWHISLSSWFRDYVYLPLGGNRVAPGKWCFNILVVFLLSGLWHGANWTFLAWGLMHGCYLLVGRTTSQFRLRLVEGTGLTKLPRAHRVLKTFVTFHLVLLAWILFRANTMSDAAYVIGHLFTGIDFPLHGFSQVFSRPEFILAVLAIFFMESVHLLQNGSSFLDFLKKRPPAVRWCVYYVLVVGILAFGVFSSEQFIYFQF